MKIHSASTYLLPRNKQHIIPLIWDWRTLLRSFTEWMNFRTPVRR